MTVAPRAFAAALLVILPLSFPAAAQDATMKLCGEKWQAAKAAGATNGATWPKFLAECRAGGAPAPSTVAATDQRAQGPLGASAPAVGPNPAGTAVFPAAVSAKFADLRPAQARQKTCSEQYQANKATGANAGLRWRAKDGYWSQCNRKLKGA